MKYYANKHDFEIKSASEILEEVRADVKWAYEAENCKYSENTVAEHYNETIADDFILVPTMISKFCKSDRGFVSQSLKLAVAGQMNNLKTLVDIKLAS